MDLIGCNLQAVKERITNAALACGRSPASIDLIAVSKGFAASAVAAAHAHGQDAFGESYVQEAVEKISALATQNGDARGPSAGVASPSLTPDLSPRGREELRGSLLPEKEGSWGKKGPLLRPLEWHFIGPIQSNKTTAIARNFAWAHSIDRAKIAERLSSARPAELPPLQVCIQVKIGDENSKSGVAPDQVLELARVVVAQRRLKLRGLMAIPPVSEDHTQQRRYFAQLRQIKDQLADGGFPLDTLSMGMSGDFEAAIMEGATMVRVGTAIFGARQ